MHRRHFLGLACLGAALTAGAAAAGGVDPLLEAGRTIYQTAYRTDGSPVIALVQQDVPLPAGVGACTTCHRRSGIGVAEGGSRSLNLTAPYLFAPTTKPPIRPAYDEDSIRRALTEGIAADGRKLDDLMPHYSVNADDVRALTAYLRTLGAAPSPGVTDADLEVATIVAADAPAEEREAVAAVVARYVEIKNAGTRREADRAAASDRHYYGHSRDRAYRHWNWHLWTLEGPASTWDAQLEKRYAENPPFAVVSGTTGHDWQIVHDFCERERLPCILPFADRVGDDHDFYSLYYTDGAALEARVTARSIAEHASSTPQTVLLLYNGDAHGEAARTALAATLSSTEHVTLREQRVPVGVAPSTRDWSRLLAATRPDALVAWLDTKQLIGLAAAAPGTLPLPPAIYTAQSFTDWTAGPALPATFTQRVLHVYPYELPDGQGHALERERIWLKFRGLADQPLLPAAHALFACHVFGEALADMESVFSREYLLETLEHSLDGTQMTNIYPITVLGPDQRTISRGAYVTQLGVPGGPPFANAHWIEP